MKQPKAKLTNELLEYLADVFITKNLLAAGWEFHEFVDAYRLGYIQEQ